MLVGDNPRLRGRSHECVGLSPIYPGIIPDRGGRSHECMGLSQACMGRSQSQGRSPKYVESPDFCFKDLGQIQSKCEIPVFNHYFKCELSPSSETISLKFNCNAKLKRPILFFFVAFFTLQLSYFLHLSVLLQLIFT